MMDQEIKKYTKVLVLLLLLLGTSFSLTRVELGQFNTIIGLTIASLKGLLVLYYFMHLQTDEGLPRIAAIVGIFWLSIFVFLVLTDYFSRNWLDLPGSFSLRQNV